MDCPRIQDVSKLPTQRATLPLPTVKVDRTKAPAVGSSRPLRASARFHLAEFGLARQSKTAAAKNGPTISRSRVEIRRTAHLYPPAAQVAAQVRGPAAPQPAIQSGSGGTTEPRLDPAPAVPDPATVLPTLGVTRSRAAEQQLKKPTPERSGIGFTSRSDIPEPPSFDGIVQRRFILDSDPRHPSSSSAGGWYEFWFDSSTGKTMPPEIAALNPSGRTGWVRFEPGGSAGVLLRARGVPYRRVMPGPLAGVRAAGSVMTTEAGTRPATAHLASPLSLATAGGDRAGMSAFDINFENQPQDRQVSSVRLYLKLSHPHLDQITIWLAAGDREAVLWDGRGGSG